MPSSWPICCGTPSQRTDGNASRQFNLPAGNCPDDQKRFGRCRDSFGQRTVRRFVREVLLAREKSHEWPALLGDVIADRSAQHRVAIFQRIQDRSQRRRPADLEFTSPLIRARFRKCAGSTTRII